MKGKTKTKRRPRSKPGGMRQRTTKPKLSQSKALRACLPDRQAQGGASSLLLRELTKAKEQLEKERETFFPILHKAP
jgi:hypothetical protein